jgi:hypothetical protein
MAELVRTVYDLPNRYLKCRGFGHRWDEFVPVGMPAPSFGFRYALRCDSCTTERYDIIDATGGVADRQYAYPDDYKLDVATDKAEIRLIYEARSRKVRQRKVYRGHLERSA